MEHTTHGIAVRQFLYRSPKLLGEVLNTHLSLYNKLITATKVGKKNEQRITNHDKFAPILLRRGGFVTLVGNLPVKFFDERSVSPLVHPITRSYLQKLMNRFELNL